MWTAQERASDAAGVLNLRNEDLDRDRCKPGYAVDMLEDLRWFGLEWAEGPDCGGPFAPYVQSERRGFYVEALQRLWEGGWIYPCRCSRRDVQQALQAPHAADDEPVYPGTCRGWEEGRARGRSWLPGPRALAKGAPTADAARINWRFRVPDGETILWADEFCGPQRWVAGREFGDFVVWRHDDVPAYQLAVTVDDARMGITEVVRGADLLVSTARQLLLYRALGWPAPRFYHCPLMLDAAGVRLAKRHDALSLRTLRAAGRTPESLRAGWADVPIPRR